MSAEMRQELKIVSSKLKPTRETSIFPGPTDEGDRQIQGKPVICFLSCVPIRVVGLNSYPDSFLSFHCFFITAIIETLASIAIS